MLPPSCHAIRGTPSARLARREEHSSTSPSPLTALNGPGLPLAQASQAGTLSGDEPKVTQLALQVHDDAPGLTALAGEIFRDPRTGKIRLLASGGEEVTFFSEL